MAKKKQKASKAKPKDTTRYVTGIVIAIIVIVVLILLIRSLTKPSAQVPTGPTAPQPTPPGVVATAQAPELVKNCSTSYAIGWPKSTVITPCKVEGNSVKLTLMNSGRGASIAGLWFKASNLDDSKISYYEAKGDIAQGQNKDYTIDITGMSSVIAMPIIIQDGKEKACLNQQLIVVKGQSCTYGK